MAATEIPLDSERLNQAIIATRLGAVFLLRPRSKTPGWKGWQRQATRDADEVRRRFQKDPQSNYGIIPNAGLFAVDFDAGSLDFELPATVTAITGGGGERRHRWFALPVELEGHGVKGRVGIRPGVDVVGNSGSPQYVVGVGSIHPDTGNAYAWVPGLSPDDVPIATAPGELMQLLRDAGLLISPHEGARPASCGKRPLPTIIPDGRRWRTVQSVLGRAWNEPNTTLADLETLAVQLHGRCEQPLGRPYTVEEALESARYVASKAKHKIAGTRQIVARLSELVSSIRWSGLRGHNTRKLLEAYLEKARRCNTLDLSISDRQAAEIIGTQPNTANRAKKALITEGFLQPRVTNGNGLAGTYRLQLPHQRNGQDLHTMATPDPMAFKCVKFDRTADIFRHGKNRPGTIGQLVFSALESGKHWKTAAALATALRQNCRSVSRKLRQLEEAGLATKGKAGWRRGPATFTPTFRDRDRDIISHKCERWFYHAKLTAKGQRVDVGTTPTISVQDWAELSVKLNTRRRLKLFHRLVAAHRTASPELQAKLEFLPVDTSRVLVLRPRATRAEHRQAVGADIARAGSVGTSLVAVQ